MKKYSIFKVIIKVMPNMVRLLLSVFLFVITPAFSAESEFEDAFANGSIRGEVKLFYYDIDINKKNAYATSLGGYLKYSTDVKKTLYGSVRFHTSNPIGNNKNKMVTQLFNNDKDGDALTTISESYIGFQHNQQLIRVGNLMLNTPMMNDDTTRIVPWSYQGVAYTGETLPDTKLQLYHITQIRSNTSDEYKKESASGRIDEGITMLGLHYNGIDELSLQGYYYYAPELYSTFITQIDYKHVIDQDDFFCAGIQYFKSGNGGKYADTEAANGGDDIDLLALKAGLDADNWSVTLNYSQNFGLSGILKGYGGLAKVYTTSMIANGRVNYKPETWMLKTRYDFPTTNWGQSEVALWLTDTRVNDSRGNDFDSYYLHWRHYLNINTSIFIRFENLDYKTAKDDATFLRVITSYRF